MNIIWDAPRAVPTLYFRDLQLNEAFKLTTGNVVYVKVSKRAGSHGNRYEDYHMLELATGKLFDPSNSPVERVDVTVSVGLKKPAIY